MIVGVRNIFNFIVEGTVQQVVNWFCVVQGGAKGWVPVKWSMSVPVANFLIS